MCGRYATTRTATDLATIFDAIDTTSVDEPMAVDYNVAPTDPVPIVRMSTSAGGRALSVARWGLVPPWAPDRRMGARMINARAETVATAKAFARPFAVRRCLIPATGWYEFAAPPVVPLPGTPPRTALSGSRPPGPWATGRARKQPYFMTPYDGGPVVFGGLWSVWGPPGERTLTCSIVTMEALGALRTVHDRMPLFLSPDRWRVWLTATGGLDTLLAPPSADEIAALEIRPVGVAVGDVRNDGPDLITRVNEWSVEPADLTLF